MQPEVNFRYDVNPDGQVFIVLEFVNADGTRNVYPFLPEVALALATSLGQMGQEGLIQNKALQARTTQPLVLRAMGGEGQGNGEPQGTLTLVSNDEDPSL